MDSTRFDDFTRTMANAPTRRKFLTVLGGGFVAAVGGLVAARDSAAASPSLCNHWCRNMGLTGRAFGQCVSSCARAGGPPEDEPEDPQDPPQESCVGEEEVCDPNGAPCCDSQWGYSLSCVDVSDTETPYHICISTT